MAPCDNWAQAQSNSLVATLFAGVLGAVCFGALGFLIWAPSVPAVATVGFVLGVALRAVWLMQRKKKLDAQATSLNTELDALKQKKFELRYEETRRAGAFKQWEQPE